MKQLVNTKSKKQIRDQQFILKSLEVVGMRSDWGWREGRWCWKDFHEGKRYTESGKYRTAHKAKWTLFIKKKI